MRLTVSIVQQSSGTYPASWVHFFEATRGTARRRPARAAPHAGCGVREGLPTTHMGWSGCCEGMASEEILHLMGSGLRYSNDVLEL